MGQPQSWVCPPVLLNSGGTLEPGQEGLGEGGMTLVLQYLLKIVYHLSSL